MHPNTWTAWKSVDLIVCHEQQPQHLNNFFYFFFISLRVEINERPFSHLYKSGEDKKGMWKKELAKMIIAMREWMG